MDAGQAIVLALVQGLTEFLPISSSAHLVLCRHVLGAPEGPADLAFDVALHLGTLLAVLVWFRGDLVRLGRALRMPGAAGAGGEARLAWGILVATVPVGLGGILLGTGADLLRKPLWIAIATIVFGVLLWHADRLGRRDRAIHEIAWLDVLGVGLAQALALVPGTSRSGITMTAGLYLGLDRCAAARFSFLLSIPVILAASALSLATLLEAGSDPDWGSLLLGTAVAGASAFACIEFFMRLIERVGYAPFVAYRLLLGAVLLLA